METPIRAGLAPGVAGDGHDAAEALDDHVVGRLVRVRAGMAEAEAAA